MLKSTEEVASNDQATLAPLGSFSQASTNLPGAIGSSLLNWPAASHWTGTTCATAASQSASTVTVTMRGSLFMRPSLGSRWAAVQEEVSLLTLSQWQGLGCVGKMNTC